MSNGLHGALLEFERRGRGIVSEVAGNGFTTGGARNTTQEQAVLHFMDTLTSVYLSEGLQLSAGLLRESANGKLHGYTSWLVGLSVSAWVWAGVQRSVVDDCLCGRATV